MKPWQVLGLVGLVVCPAIPAAAAAKAPLSDRVVRYDIQVKLDPASKRLEGREVLSWRNTSPRSEERRVGKECRSRWSPYH